MKTIYTALSTFIAGLTPMQQSKTPTHNLLHGILELSQFSYTRGYEYIINQIKNKMILGKQELQKRWRQWCQFYWNFSLIA